LAEALPDEQQRALALLSNGEPIRMAADKTGVNRGTVYRWIKAGAHFRAAYNAWQQEQRESCRLGLLKCAEQAVARIALRIQYDEDLAFKLAKELGLFKGGHGR
jgi:transposase-like protein